MVFPLLTPLLVLLITSTALRTNGTTALVPWIPSEESCPTQPFANNETSPPLNPSPTMSLIDLRGLVVLVAVLVFISATILIEEAQFDAFEAPITFLEQSEELSYMPLRLEPSAEVEEEESRVVLSVRPIPVADIDPQFELPEPEHIQDAYLVSANFSGPLQMAHPDRSLLYVHYRPHGRPDQPRVVLKHADRHARLYNEKTTGIEWEFVMDVWDANTSFSAEEIEKGFYAIHKIRVHFPNEAATRNVINRQRAVFKVQRALVPRPAEPIEKEAAIPRTTVLKSIRNTIKTGLQDIAGRFRKRDEPEARKVHSEPALGSGVESTC